MAEPRGGERGQVPAEELAGHRLLRHGRARQVGIESLEQPRPCRRSRLPRPESPHLGLAEEVVAGEHLVRALPGEHGFNAGLADKARQQKQRRRCRAQDGPLGVRDDCGKALRDVSPGYHDLVVFAAQARDHLALVGGLIVFRVVKAQREGVELRALCRQCEGCDERTVKTAGQVAADRHIGTQHPQRGRLFERGTHAPGRLLY
jgi:hypothetical protein